MKKFVVSFISALLLALSFISAIPVGAASGSGVGSSSDVIRVKRFSQMIDYAKNYNIDIENSHYIMTYYEDSSQYYWWYYIFFIPDDFLVDNTLNLTHGKIEKYGYASSIDGRVSDYGDSDSMDISFNDNVSIFGYKFYFDDDEQSHSYPNHIFKSNIKITNNGDDVTPTDPNAPFKSPVNAQFDFKSDLEFFCCLNDNVTSLPVDNRVWIEVYDTLVAVETLVYKPYKYVYTNTITSSSPDVPNKYEQVIGDYLLANSVGPYYSISVDTLLHAGCKTDYFYTVRAFVYNGSEPFEIANLTFKISSEGISTVDPSLKDPDNPDDPIIKTWNNDNRTYNYYNVNTGAEVDKDKLVYKFDSSVDPSVNGSGQDISDFDFNSDFSTDLTQGAGLVRTLFDKIIQSMGLSGFFMITVLSVAVVGWFIFGSRR